MSEDGQEDPTEALLSNPEPGSPSSEIRSSAPYHVRFAVIFCILVDEDAKEPVQNVNLRLRFNLFDEHLIETEPLHEWPSLAQFNGPFEKDSDVAVEEAKPGQDVQDGQHGQHDEDIQNVQVCGEKKLLPRFWKFVVEQRVTPDLLQHINRNPEVVIAVGSNEAPFLSFRSIEVSPLLDNDGICVFDSGKPTGIESKLARICSSDLRQRKERRYIIDTLFEGFHASVHVEKDLLNTSMIEQLRPFSVKIKTARCLPGTLFEEDASELNAELVNERGEVDPFQLCKRYCDPVYASFTIFEGFPIRRSVTTVGVPQGASKVKIDHKVTVLLGDCDPVHIAEHFQTTALRVELHDRDVDVSIKPKDIFSSLKGEHQSISKSGKLAKWEEFQSRWKCYLDPHPSDEENGEILASETDEESKDNPQEAMTVFDVDKIAWRGLLEDRYAQMQKQCHGESVFPLTELCASYTDISRSLVSRRGNAVIPFSSTNKAIDIKCVSNVVPANRRISSNGRIAQAEMDLTVEERHVRQPGRYLRANTELKIELSLTYPLLLHQDGLETSKHRTPNAKEASDETNPMQFQRHVYVFAYENSKLLQKIRAVVDEINAQAIPGAALRTHQLSETEQAGAEDGNLDIVTGFQCVDDEFRIVVLEGLGMGNMALLGERLARERANDDQYKVLSNSQQTFTKRLYAAFSLDLKVIRLREPLGIVVRFPEIYDHRRVCAACYGALQFLCEMRNATRIEFLKRESFFPTVDMLQVLESKYGESVSILDITGVAAKPLKRRSKNKQSEDGAIVSQPLGISSNQIDHERDEEPITTIAKPGRKAATDSHNAAYEERRRGYKAKNFIMENEKGRAEALAAGKQRLEAREAVARELLEDYVKSSGQKEVFMCSGQKLNFIEWQKSRLRDKLSKNKGATYTYSKQFQSLSFCLVDEDRVAQEEKEKNQHRFTTSSGFIYPAPRTAKECREHPRKLSKARIEELQQPYDFSRMTNSGDLEDRQDLEDFDCVPSKEYNVFGGYNKDSTKNPEFFKSVHLVGKEVHEEMEERKRKEVEEWRNKIVVDNLRFLPYSGTRAHKPSQLDKLKGILRGKPIKRGLKVVARATLPSGKRIPLKPPPVSMFSHKNTSNH